MGDDYKKTGRCRYSVSSPLSYTMAICFGLQRNGHANRAINYVYVEHSTWVKCMQSENELVPQVAFSLGRRPD